MRRTIQTYLLAVVCASAQTTINGGRVVTGAWDASNAASSKPARTGASLPAACGVGEQFFLTSAPAGNNLYLCASPNNWSPVSSPLGAQAANQIYAGPASGAPAVPAFRSLAKTDLLSTSVYADQSNIFTAGVQDMSGAGATLPAKMGSALPATCRQGEFFVLSTALPGRNLNLCYAANSWVQIGGGSGGGANGGAAALAGNCVSGLTGAIYYPSDGPYTLWCDGSAWRYRLSGASVTPADDSQFQWDAQNGAAITVKGGTTPTVGDVYMSVPANGALSRRAMANPYGNVWTLTAVIAGSPTVNINGSEFGAFGIYFRNSATADAYSTNTGTLRFDYIGGNGLGQLSFVAEDRSDSTYSQGSWRGVTAYNDVTTSGPLWLRMHADGTNVTAQTSADFGQNWATFAVLPISIVTGPSGSIAEIGWFVSASNNTFGTGASLLQWSIINQ